MVKVLKLCLLFILLSNYRIVGQTKNAWLDKLKETISEAAVHDAKKINRIDHLRQNLHAEAGNNMFERYLQLYDEFVVFNFDSAYFYANKLLETARSSGDTAAVTYANIKIKFVLLSSGMYKEVFDSLTTMVPGDLDDEGKSEYYILKARSLFDLAEYNHDKIFSNTYNRKADLYIDSALQIFSPGSFQFYYYNGLKALRSGNLKSANAFFANIISDTTLSLHQQAIIFSTVSDIYIRRGEPDSAIIFLAKAAMADIRSSTRETSAIFNLATLLFKLGDLDNATIFIQKASSDAKLYGARQRMLQLSNILPLIEAERINLVQKEKETVIRYAAIITILLLVLMVMIFLVIRQVRRLKLQQKEIRDKNISLHRLVEEKEWLIMEIHHRVKNNLHTISSLLESQSVFLKNEALVAIRDTQHRVVAMSLIHQKLYQPERNVMGIDMAGYIHELVNYLTESFEIRSQINFVMELDPIHLDISKAVPMGLILNEAITNAVKYAFPEGRSGVITISIKRTGKEKFAFVVSDNGIGLPHNFDISRINSLGMKLMKGLSDDLGAVFNVKSIPGTRIYIECTISMTDNTGRSATNPNKR